MSWKEEMILELIKILSSEPNWKKIATTIKNVKSTRSVHLAIFTEELMEKLITGEKKVESRFSNNFISPHGKIKKGDLIAVKKSGGAVTAVFIAGDVTSYKNLNNAKVMELKKKYTIKLGLSIKDPFWTAKANAKYATFVTVNNVKRIHPFFIGKKDRRSWIVVKTSNEGYLF